MGAVKVLFFLLIIGVSVYGQEDVIINEDERTVSDGGVGGTDLDFSGGVAPAEEAAEAIKPESKAEQPVELIRGEETPSVIVRSGAYQLSDDALTPDNVAPDTVNAVNFNTADLNEKQLLNPPTTINTNTEFAHIDGRILPATFYQNNGQPYIITNQRLSQIRGNFMYWFYDQGGDENIGDYQRDIHSSNPQVHKNFNFQLPFFGFRFNYTRVSMHGYLQFSDPPDHYTYPLSFPVRDWPDINDPSFIGIFFSKCRIGNIRPTDPDQRRPGVYFRMDRDLQTRTDQLGVEMRERVTWDIRNGVIGADSFFPKHAVTITWKNMSFAGGIDNSLFRTNTFQMVLATDEVFTYAIFNYLEISWSSHTEAGGDTTGGEGGVPAYIGFNAGNGTQSYEYKPYSQASVLRDLTGRGLANGFPGRHIFRIDEKILMGTCNKDIDGANLPLMFAPESGNMLGGTIVNITGPCFLPTDKVSCRFDTETVRGLVVDQNRAICVQPRFWHNGYARFEIAINNEPYKWKGKFFVETPATASEKIFFSDNAVNERYPPEIRITWDRYNLTANFNSMLRISLWGYKETTIRPQLEYIDMLEDGVSNTGQYIISPQTYRNRDNILHRDMQFGFIQINLTTPETYGDVCVSPVLWSRPIPLGWYFAPQWEKLHGSHWPQALCRDWIENEASHEDSLEYAVSCPCTLKQALLDKGHFMPDPNCDKDSNRTCRFHWGAVHCVRSGSPSEHYSGQECCYSKHGDLMRHEEGMWGSKRQRSHEFGLAPYNKTNKVPSLSHWVRDIMPFYQCCIWQEEGTLGCVVYGHASRVDQRCSGDRPRTVVGTVDDLHHITTFDQIRYKFNNKGEYVLVRIEHPELNMNVQGRFEQVPRELHDTANAIQLTSVVAAFKDSVTVEVRLRPSLAQWRYRLDVFADYKRVYFDKPSLRVKYFPSGVTVYQPTYIQNQSQIIIMFSSGAGVEVVENEGFMSTRVFLPRDLHAKYRFHTGGLFGLWSFYDKDDFTTPDGNLAHVNPNDFADIHRKFGRKWQLTDQEQKNIGVALFVREFGRTAAYYNNYDNDSLPDSTSESSVSLPENRSEDVREAERMCPCQYDYETTRNRDSTGLIKNESTVAGESKTLCETIHVALVCMGNCTRLVTPMLKSLLSHRQNPIHFHFVVDSISQLPISTLFYTWDLPDVKYTTYNVQDRLSQVQWVPNTHYSGVSALVKLLVPDILPSSLHRVIVLNANLTFMSDIAELWRMFDNKAEYQLIGLVENANDPYYDAKERWPALGRGYNTGVMLLDLMHLREHTNWTVLWHDAVNENLDRHTTFADQDIINAVIKEYPHIIYNINYQYNIQMSTYISARTYYGEDIHNVKIVNWDSPQKHYAETRDVKYFRSIQQSYVNLDGNLLRKKLHICNPDENVTYETSDSDLCSELRAAQRIKLRTHPYYMDYSHNQRYDFDVTLVLQLSMDRLQFLERLIEYWEGPVSVALYLSDYEVTKFEKQWSRILSKRTNIAYHLVYRDDSVHYPVNYLRNVALENANTPYLFLMDVEFTPMSGLYKYLTKALQVINPGLRNKCLVVAAFEYRLFSMPNNTALLAKTLVPLGEHATDYVRWINATAPYEVEWQEDYEPYLVVHRSVPEYDTRFSSFSWSKASHAVELRALGYRPIVLPEVSIVRNLEAHSIYTRDFQDTTDSDTCLTLIKQEFMDDLRQKQEEMFDLDDLAEAERPYLGQTYKQLMNQTEAVPFI